MSSDDHHPRRGTGELTDRVLDVVRSADGWSTVRDVHRELAADGELAYTTVLTVLQRLAQRGLLEHERVGRSGRYRVVANADSRGARSIVDHAISRFGSVAVAQFVERTREDPELLAELRRRLEREGDHGA